VREFDAGSGHRLPGEWRDEVVRSLLEEVIEQHLLAQQAQARRLEVAEADVQEGMQQIRDEYPSPEAFRKAQPDMTPERLRQRTRRTLLAARLLKAEIDPKISVSDGEAKAFYDQNLPRFAEGNRKPPPFAALRKTIVDYLADQQREQKTDAFLKDLKARAKIEIF
jgi:peptidyl-prolyl cis-trans isomerase C